MGRSSQQGNISFSLHAMPACLSIQILYPPIDTWIHLKLMLQCIKVRYSDHYIELYGYMQLTVEHMLQVCVWRDQCIVNRTRCSFGVSHPLELCAGPLSWMTTFVQADFTATKVP